jgi:hypothetical protein
VYSLVLIDRSKVAYGPFCDGDKPISSLTRPTFIHLHTQRMRRFLSTTGWFLLLFQLFVVPANAQKLSIQSLVSHVENAIDHHQSLAEELTVSAKRLEIVCSKLSQVVPLTQLKTVQIDAEIRRIDRAYRPAMSLQIKALEAAGKSLEERHSAHCKLGKAQEGTPSDQCLDISRTLTVQKSLTLQTKILSELLTRDLNALRMVADLELKQCVRPGFTMKLIDVLEAPNEFGFKQTIEKISQSLTLITETPLPAEKK